MSRQARRRVKREEAKQPQQTIQLQNPVAQHFEAFIFGNSLLCDDVVQENSAEGQHVVICGAGPSLAENALLWCAEGDQVWGCNSALTWLASNGYKVTHGITVDQTAHMLTEWAPLPDVEYLIASSVHPHLTELLKQRERRYRFFHNYVGLKKPPVQLEGGVMSYEDWMYTTLYPRTCMAGSGLNTVTRAIDVALYMGFAKVTVLGADCALRTRRPRPNVPFGSEEHRRWLDEDVTMHADGGSALASGATAVTLEGEIDGRVWTTKPDMSISAQWLVQMKKVYGERIQLIGDTLPNALMDKGQDFMDRLPTLTDSAGNPLRFTA
jgi:hypothetical protein